MYWIGVVLVAALVNIAQAQLTAQTSVAPDLRECYMNPELLNANNLPPTTISVLIDIIRQIEDNPDINDNLRELSSRLLHSYRQDGIEFHRSDTSMTSANVIPFAPTHHSFYRHKLLLTRLIPNNLQVLPNTTLNSAYKCAIHRMLSTTIDTRLRGDENICNQLSQYRALRLPRSASDTINEDVEMLDDAMMKSVDRNGQMRVYDPDNDVEFTGAAGGAPLERQTAQSQCPLLGGVIHTLWGAVSAGNLIAGIAAGAQPQQVSISELLKYNIQLNSNVPERVNSIYPATLAGDLAEASLIQGTERASTSISVGASGGWNSTQARRYYMIQTLINNEMTDAEIRGGIDGYVLGSSVENTINTFGSLKLSQFLDMYYSPRNGVFNPSLRACNRRDLTQSMINAETLTRETYSFATALDTNLPLRGTITGGLDLLVNSAVNNFQTYTTSNLNDMSCIATESSPDYRLKTNLYLVLDATWQYEAIYPAISYILDSIEIGKYGSSVTLLSAADGSILINKTFSPAEFHSSYTLQRHQSMISAVNLLSVYTNVRSLMFNELDLERDRNYVGGNSTVLLFMLNTLNIPNNNEVWQEARMINDTVPDLRVLYATSSNHFDDLHNLVRDMHNDIKTIPLSSGGNNVETIIDPVLDRIKLVGRRIVNPNCGSAWSGIDTGNYQFEDNLEPGFANFYTISSNYFYQPKETRRLRIQRSGVVSGNLLVCHSRTIQQPRENSTLSGMEPDTVICINANTENVEIDLQNPCDGYSFIGECPPYYISVQSTAATILNPTCTVAACRFPYNIRYQVQATDFGCYNSARNVVANITFIITALLLSILRFN